MVQWAHAERDRATDWPGYRRTSGLEHAHQDSAQQGNGRTVASRYVLVGSDITMHAHSDIQNDTLVACAQQGYGCSVASRYVLVDSGITEYAHWDIQDKTMVACEQQSNVHPSSADWSRCSWFSTLIVYC